MWNEMNGVGYVDDIEECEDDWNGAVDDPDDQVRYSMGQCHALALALCVRRPEFSLATITDRDHVLAVTPKGLVLDVFGSYSLGDPWTWPARDGASRTGYPTPYFIEELKWDEMAQLLEDGYCTPVLDEHTFEVADRVLARHGL